MLEDFLKRPEKLRKSQFTITSIQFRKHCIQDAETRIFAIPTISKG